MQQDVSCSYLQYLTESACDNDFLTPVKRHKVNIGYCMIVNCKTKSFIFLTECLPLCWLFQTTQDCSDTPVRLQAPTEEEIKRFYKSVADSG